MDAPGVLVVFFSVSRTPDGACERKHEFFLSKGAAERARPTVQHFVVAARHSVPLRSS